MDARDRSHRARTRLELEALASPARQEFVSGLRALQPCTMHELGKHLGRKPASLYYHLRKLEEAGLVVAAQERTTDRGKEVLYRMRSRQVRVEPDRRRGADLALLRKVGGGILRLATRLHDRAVAFAPERTKLRRRHLLAQETRRLTPAGLVRINRKLHELLEALDQEETLGEGKEFFTLTVHLAPNTLRGASERTK